MLSFLAMSLLGALFLMLPISNTNGQWRDFISAFFMSVSSVCVTGLAVVDVGHDFSLFGESVILVLMQIGGLSYMTFTTILMYMIGKRLSISDTKIFDLSNNSDRQIDFAGFVLKIGILTLIIEAIGFLFLIVDSYKACLLESPFSSMVELIPKSLFQALFHSVSAFCNAGLSLYSNSLEGFRENYWVLFIFSLLPILGGLGYTVLTEFMHWLETRKKKRKHYFSLHARVSLVLTAILLVVGVLIQLVLIYGQDLPSLNDQGFFDKLWVSFFQSCAARSSGFNSIPLVELGDSSLLFLIVWMIIGACPGGTGGGIKVTTLAIIIAIIGANLKNKKEVRIFNRSIPDFDQKRAVTVIISTILGITLCVVVIAALEWGKGIRFIDHLFEVTSAFTTVGLSTGITGSLSSPSLLILCLCMLVGRPGPLLFLMAIISEEDTKPGTHPEEGILIG